MRSFIIACFLLCALAACGVAQVAPNDPAAAPANNPTPYPTYPVTNTRVPGTPGAGSVCDPSNGGFCPLTPYPTTHP